MILRKIEDGIQKKLHRGKAEILLGLRQTSKTTLVKKVCSMGSNDSIWLTGDDANDNTRLKNSSIFTLKTLIGKNKFLVIDEA